MTLPSSPQTSPDRQCGACAKPIGKINPEVTIDGKLVCSQECFGSIAATEGEHEFVISWQNPNVPADAEVEKILSILQPSLPNTQRG